MTATLRKSKFQSAKTQNVGSFKVIIKKPF